MPLDGPPWTPIVSTRIVVATLSDPGQLAQLEQICLTWFHAVEACHAQETLSAKCGHPYDELAQRCAQSVASQPLPRLRCENCRHIGQVDRVRLRLNHRGGSDNGSVHFAVCGDTNWGWKFLSREF